ncbi:hypothetical protein Plec18167_008051 [Paecilomyces lecythidis]|uniref:Enoyl reductase (ER) domain-containing protein n=1 Tax=Paecilomyces lecythidis TaxID=3004212 RepID=A0ABR3WZJ8_9EURO
MAVSHKALFVDENAQFSVVERNGPYPLDDGEVLIETIFSGVNPADIKHTTHLGIKNTVLGYDICGRIIKTKDHSKFKVGDIVAGYTPSGVGRDRKYGSHQDYTVAPESMLFNVPDNLPQKDAACLTVVTMTAADAIFNIFDLPLPSRKSEKTTETQTGPLLIWGASSSVGFCALQFAAASGHYPVLVTASPGRHDSLIKLGATHCFDYSSPTVYQDIGEAIESLGPIQYAIDAVGAEPNPLASEEFQRSLSKNAKLLSVIVRNDKKFGMPVATPHQDFVIQPPGVPHVITVPGRPESLEKAWTALLWAAENYGRSFRLPPVEVFNGSAEEALEELHKVANGSRGFGKLAIPHPIK